MSDVSTWSTTAGNNNSSPPDGWPEDQSPSSVNNCGREMMASIKRWYDGINAALAGTIRGCVPSNAADTDHDISFSAGTYIGSSREYTLPAYTKQFDAAFAEGTNAGGLGDSVSLPTTGAFYVFAISKDSSPSTVDYYGDTDDGGANVPTGWTVLREIFRVMTDGSANLPVFVATGTSGGGLYVEFDVMTREFEDSNPGTSRVDKTLSRVPPDTDAVIYVDFIDLTPSAATSYLLCTRKDQTDTPADAQNHHIDLRSASGDPASRSARVDLRTNSSRIVCYRIDTSTSDHFVRMTPAAYTLERR